MVSPVPANYQIKEDIEDTEDTDQSIWAVTALSLKLVREELSTCLPI